MPGLWHSVAHCGPIALVAVSADRPVGVDVETGPRSREPGVLAARFFPPAEAGTLRPGLGEVEVRRRYLRLWTRKEACVKAAGGRLFEGLRLPVLPGPVVRGTVGGAPGCWWVRDLPIVGPPEAPAPAAAVAVAGPDPCEIRFRRYPAAWSRPAPAVALGQHGQPPPPGEIVEVVRATGADHVVPRSDGGRQAEQRGDTPLV